MAKLTSITTYLVPAGSARQVASSSPLRERILFLTGNVVGSTVNTRLPAAAGDGLVLRGDGGGLEFTREKHGDVVGMAWYAGFGNDNFAVVETVGEA